MTQQYFKTLYRSFYSTAAYKNALENWQGFGLKYFLIMILITSFISSLFWSISILKINPERTADSITGFILSEPDLTFEENINRFINILHQTPQMRLENGIIYTEAKQPYSIVDPISKYDVAIIDTTGKYKSLEGTDASLLITKDAILIRDARITNSDKEKIIYLRELSQNYNIDEPKINEMLFILSQIPVFGLHDGRFFTEDNNTHNILDSAGSVIGQIGPDAKLNDKTFEPMFAINEDALNFKTPLTLKAAKIHASYITEETMFDFFKLITQKIKKYMLVGIPAIGWPVVALTSFIFGIFTLTFYSAICYAFIKITKAGEFNFKQIVRITTVAVTPIQIIGVAAPQLIPSQGLVYFLITIGYLYFAIKSVTRG